jgi:hypothetical protein
MVVPKETHLELSALERLAAVAPEVIESPEPGQSLSHVGGLLAETAASSVLYPENMMAAPSVNLRINPLQIIRVDPATFIEGEAQVQLQAFACEDLATTSEFELLLRAYLTALKEKQKNGKPLSVLNFLSIFLTSRPLAVM